MFEDIQKHRQAVQENIEKSFQIGFTENEDLQKAHNVGDIHPNGKWVWTQLPSGKCDWRVIKKTTQGAGNATPAAKQEDTQKPTPKSSVVGAKTFEDVLAAYQKGGINVVQTFDGKTYDLFEYEKQKKIALSSSESARSLGTQIIKTNIKKTQKEIDDTKKIAPGARARIAKHERDLAKFNAQLKANEDAEEELKKNGKEVKVDKKSSVLIEDTLQKIKQFSYIHWDDKKIPNIKKTLEENEEIVRSVMRATFPSVPGNTMPPNTNKVDIDGQVFTFGAYCTIDTMFQNSHFGKIKTNHYFVKNGDGKTIASCTTSGRWNTPTDAKNTCKVDVLRTLLKL